MALDYFELSYPTLFSLLCVVKVWGRGRAILFPLCKQQGKHASTEPVAHLWPEVTTRGCRQKLPITWFQKPTVGSAMGQGDGSVGNGASYRSLVIQVPSLEPT